MQVEIKHTFSEYYIATVEQEEYDWTFKMNDGAIGKEPWVSIDTWCEKTFGEQGMWGGPNSAWKRMGPSYYFQYERDREIFMLRWA